MRWPRVVPPSVLLIAPIAGALWMALHVYVPSGPSVRGPVAPAVRGVGAAGSDLEAVADGGFPAPRVPAAAARDEVEPSLVVHARDGAGAVVGPGFAISLRSREGRGDEVRVPLDGDGCAALAVPPRDAILSLVGPVVEVLAPSSPVAPMAGSQGRLLAWTSLPAGSAGPRTVAFSTERWELRARILDADGAPLRGEHVDVTLRGSAAHSASHLFSLRTGPDGEARVGYAVDPSHLGNPAAAVAFSSPGPAPDEPLARAEVPLRLLRAETRGVRELGDVRLARQGTIVAGQVTGENGSPLPEGNVRLQRRAPGETRYRDTGDEAPIVEGAFRVSGTRTDAGDLRLVLVDAGAWVAEPVPFRAGREDVHVLARPGARLRARVLLPPQADHRQVKVELAPLSGEDPRTRELEWPELCAFGLPFGVHELRVSVHGRILAREAVSIGPAGVSEVEVDLRAALQRVRVTWSSRDGPLARASALVLGPGSTFALEGAEGADVWCAGPFDLRVRAAGCERAELHGVERDVNLVLQRGAWPVRVELTGLPKLYGGPEWSLSLRDGAERCVCEPRTGEEGQAGFLLDAPGAWEVVLTLALRGPWSYTTRAVPLGEIEVVPNERGLQTFRVCVPGDFLDRANL